MDKIVYASATPVVTAASAYASGNAVGGLLTFSDLVDRGYSSLYSAVIVDKSGQSQPMDLLLFDKAITAPTNKAAVAISAADMAFCIGNIKFVAGDYSSSGTGSVATRLALFLGMDETLDNNVYGVLVSRGTPTFASASDIIVKLSAEIGPT